MAYNLGKRFPPQPENFRILEPAAYQIDETFDNKPNKAPFLSKTERTNIMGNKIWTEALYYADQVPKIPNCASMMSKMPRFPYESLSKEDLEAILCRCGLQNVCECSEENEQQPEVHCQAKIRRRLFKSHLPRSDTSHSHRKHPPQSPPFYNAKVNYSTDFYQGCKWSRWKSTRTVKPEEQWPGPTSYNIEKEPNIDEICAEKVREDKRKHSKQLRFIEMIQQKNILEGRPGPATYSPQDPMGTNLGYLGPKAKRFQELIVKQAGPADHWIKRDFDPPEFPTVPCHATLPEPSFFGVKATRFKPWKEEGPSPATYSPSFNICHFTHCPTAGFGSSTVRFKPLLIDEGENDEIVDQKKPDGNEMNHESCPTPTWGFRSKTVRMPPLVKKPYEQGPADLPMTSRHVKKPKQLQFISPFDSSEGRFQPWYDWMPILGRTKTPGPGYYDAEQIRCYPAVCHGPMVRSKRFPPLIDRSPAPNKYYVNGGLETILDTQNERLKSNIKNQKQFHFDWESEVPRQMTVDEVEIMLLNKCIALCEPNVDLQMKSFQTVNQSV